MANKLQSNWFINKAISTTPLTWRRRFALVLFGLVIAIIVIEIAARALHLLPITPPDTYLQLRDTLGLMPLPYQHFYYSQPGAEFRTWVQFNYRSLRDIDHDYEKLPGTLRIMFLGDSFTAGWQVPLDQTYVSRLRSSLNQLPGRTSEYDLINAGLHGWGTDQQYLFYREEGYRYGSDLVVLQIYAGNDVVDNGIGVLGLPIDRFRPYFLLDASGTLELVPYAGPLPEPYVPEGLVSQLRWYLNENSFTYRFLSDNLQSQLDRLARPQTASQSPSLPNEMPVDYGLFAPEYDARWQTAWEITRQLIRALRKEIEAQGAQMVVLLVPARQEDNPDSWTAIAERYDLPPNWDPARPTDLFIDLLEAERIPYLDVRVSRTSYSEVTGHPLSFPIDGHWNAEGHCVAAIAIQNWLSSEGLLTVSGDYAPHNPVTICG